MRKGLLAFGVLFLFWGRVVAQTPPPGLDDVRVGPLHTRGPLVVPTTAPTLMSQIPMGYQGQTTAPTAFDPHTDYAAVPYHIWGEAEYLLWSVKNAPIPVPLVTTGDPNVGFPTVNSAGAIDQSSTRVLLGGSNANFGVFSGMRFTLGMWVDDEQTLGVEGSGFFLERRASVFAAGSDALGNPPLYFPAFNAATQAERGLAIADPLRQFSGDVFVTSALQLWGAEANGLYNVVRRPGLQFNLLAGFRYLDLVESLTIHNTTNDLLLINTTVANDYFGTRNQFYGGQIGGRLSWQHERFSFDLAAKVALGSTHQVVNIQGDITQTGPGAATPGSFPSGIFAQSSNIGRQTANQFTVVPALELKAAYQVTPRLRAVVGYDFLLWSQVVRPGNQIDHDINPSQSPVFGGGALVGQASPAPLFNRTDFWAHGVSFGAEYRY